MIIQTSWDDCFKQDLRIAQLLKKYSLPGIFYVVVDWVGTLDHLTWDDIKELESQGFEIGSHTVSHPQDLKKLHDQELEFEIQSSKDLLQSALGGIVSSFCYPRGRADERVKSFVKEAGYLEARGTGPTGIIKIDDPYYLPGTIHIFPRKDYSDKSVVEYAKETIDKAKKQDGYVNIWGHGAEVEEYGLWNDLEEILAYAKDKFTN